MLRSGRSDFSDKRPRDESSEANRTRGIDDAFHIYIDLIRPYNVCCAQWIECFAQVPRKQSGVTNDADHDAALADFWFEKDSCYLLSIFRRTNLLREHGACRVPNPLAHAVCDSNKSRAMINFLTTDNFETGKILGPDTWFKPAGFGLDHTREIQADELYGHDIASFFSGSRVVKSVSHFNTVTVSHGRFHEVPGAWHQRKNFSPNPGYARWEKPVPPSTWFPFGHHEWRFAS